MSLESYLLEQATHAGLLRSDLPLPPLQPDPPSTIWGPRIHQLLQLKRLDRTWVEHQAKRFLRGEGIHGQSDPITVELEGEPDFSERRGPGLASRYRNLEMVAMGGGGQIFRAVDTLLERVVALKFVRWDRIHVPDELLVEARAQARVKHPNVCPVLEAGTWDDQAYFSMPWIAAGSLGNVAPALSIAQKVQVMREICEGAHAAHLQGLLHLDLKLGNVLMERHGDGRWHPLVSDFGLGLHTQEGGSRRLKGLGTAPYACPELAYRDHGLLDARSDVYSLGVTLYVLLTQRLPLDQTEPGRRPEAIPPELIRIARKAMSLEVEQRYPSALALSEELGRFERMEPLQALRYSPRRKLQLWIRRNRALALAAASVLVVAVSLGAWLARSRWQAQRNALAAQRFGQDLETVEAMLALANLSPPQDQAATHREVRQRMASILSNIERLGPMSAGPGYLALGKVHMRMDEQRAAAADLQRAWDSGVHTAECAELLGQIKGMRALELRMEREPGTPATTAETSLSQEALQLLKDGPRRDRPSPTDVLIAELEGHSDAAYHLGLLALKAGPPKPWQYEGWLMLMETWDARADYLSSNGEYAECEVLLDVLQRTCERALEIGRNDPVLHFHLGQVALDRAYTASAQGLESEHFLRWGLEQFGKAHLADPEENRYVRWQGETLRRIGVVKIETGQDPLPEWARAEALLRSIAPKPQIQGGNGRWPVLLTLGRVLTARGAYLLRHGQPGLPDLDESESLLRQAQALGFQSAQLSGYLAAIALERGVNDLHRGRDASPNLDAAWDGLILSGHRSWFAVCTELEDKRAQVSLANGKDPLPELKSVAEELAREKETHPDSPDQWLSIARIQTRLAEVLAIRGDDFHQALAEALSALHHPRPFLLQRKVAVELEGRLRSLQRGVINLKASRNSSGV